MQIKIKSDFRRAKRYLTEVQKKQIPFATARAITQTLQVARRDEIVRVNRDIDRPVPWTERGFRVTGAKKTTLTGRLYILPDQLKYMKYQIFGGVRMPRGSALALRPAKTRPGDIQPNKYGNVPRTKQARALLSKGAFSGTVNGVAGIWKPPTKTKTGKLRKGSRMKLLLAYERQATYRPIFRFHITGEKSINRNWPHIWQRSIQDALRSAKR